MAVFILAFLGAQLVTQLLSVFFSYKLAEMKVHPTYTFMLLAMGFLFRSAQTFLLLFLRGTIGQSYTIYNGNILFTSWFWGGLASIFAFIAVTRFYYYSRVLYGIR